MISRRRKKKKEKKEEERRRKKRKKKKEKKEEERRRKKKKEEEQTPTTNQPPTTTNNTAHKAHTNKEDKEEKTSGCMRSLANEKRQETPECYFTVLHVQFTGFVSDRLHPIVVGVVVGQHNVFRDPDQGLFVMFFRHPPPQEFPRFHTFPWQRQNVVPVIPEKSEKRGVSLDPTRPCIQTSI